MSALEFAPLFCVWFVLRFQSFHRCAARVLASQVHASAGADRGGHARFLCATGAVAVLSGTGLAAALLGRAFSTAPLPDELVTGSLSLAGEGVLSGHLPLLLGSSVLGSLALALLVSRTGRLRLARRLALAAALVGAPLGAWLAGAPWSNAAALLAAGGVGWAARRFATPAAPRENRSVLPATASDDLVTRHDRDGRAVFVSDAAERVLGCQPSRLLGAGLFERVHIHDRVSFRRAIDEAATRGSTATCKFRLIDAEGSGTRWLELTALPDGEAEQAVCIVRDASAVRRQEEAQDEARRAAEELSAAKSRFIAVASHELRTPLNAIIGFADLLRTLDRVDEPLPHAKRMEYAELIHGAGAHLLELVGDLLDMSRIEAGRYEISIEPVDVAGTVEACVSMLAPVASERGVTVRNVADRHLPSLEADARAFRQVVINLVSNAMKFAPAGSLVTVGAVRRGDMIALTVSDRGEGMCADDVARLGRPFTQVGTSADPKRRAHEGVGLGLSIVRGLVELHGGTLNFRSVPAPAPAHGTDVTVALPIRHCPSRKTDERVVAFENPTRTCGSRSAEGPQIRSTEYGRVSA